MRDVYPMRNSMAIAEENSRFMTRVYGWMTGGIVLTALISRWVASTPELVELVFGSRFGFMFLVLLQIGAVVVLTAAMRKLSAAAATMIYFAYAALTGVTLSVIFLAYTQESIVNVFGVTACAFAGLSLFGLVTKRDLGPVGSFCMMGLFGMIGFSLISFFFPSLMTAQTSYWYSIVGLIVFAGLTAYDTQKIKSMNILGNEGTAEDQKEAIYGALTLYLDFINLFLSLLRIMGRSRD